MELDTTRARSELENEVNGNKVQFEENQGQKRKFCSMSVSKVCVIFTKKSVLSFYFEISHRMKFTFLSLISNKLYLIRVKLILDLGSRSCAVTPLFKGRSAGTILLGIIFLSLFIESRLQ